MNILLLCVSVASAMTLEEAISTVTAMTTRFEKRTRFLFPTTNPDIDAFRLAGEDVVDLFVRSAGTLSTMSPSDEFDSRLMMVSVVSRLVGGGLEEKLTGESLVSHTRQICKNILSAVLAVETSRAAIFISHFALMESAKAALRVRDKHILPVLFLREMCRLHEAVVCNELAAVGEQRNTARSLLLATMQRSMSYLVGAEVIDESWLRALVARFRAAVAQALHSIEHGGSDLTLLRSWLHIKLFQSFRSF